MKEHFDDTQVVLNLFMESETFLKVKDVFNSLRQNFSKIRLSDHFHFSSLLITVGPRNFAVVASRKVFEEEA